MRSFGNAYKNAQASIGGEFKRLPAGGYIVEIVDVKDVTAKEYLQVIFDIATGEYRGFYADAWGKEHPAAHSIYRSYKPDNMGYFKGFISCVDKSNGTNFGSLYEGDEPVNEKLLIGKRFGVIIGYEEYKTDRGDVRERTYVVQNRSTQGIEAWLQDVASGKEKLPELKKLKPEATPVSPVPGFEGLKESEIPF